MYKVNIDGKVCEAEENTLLSKLLINENIAFEHICGGKGTCKKCTVSVNGEKQLSCQYKITSDITVETENRSPVFAEIYRKSTGELTENLAFCLDLGSTTLALALVSLDKKEIIETKTADNPQRLYGADVISRIEYCKKENGVFELQDTVINAINTLISSFNLQKTPTLFVSGNATMLHLLLGVSPLSMGTAPYTPVFTEKKEIFADTIGIKGVEKIITLPLIHVFVGADIVAGLNFIKKPINNKYNLLVDLGTNAEIALYGKGKVICTSAAAGPCFEGANISQGMGARDGAVFKFGLFGGYKTIGEKTAIGICGTGLIDIAAFLLQNELIDESGFMDCEKYEVAPDVFITQKDIRQYQLAKSAVYSGIKAVLNRENVTYDDIDTLYISGGFSSEINIDNAVFTRLLPMQLKSKCIAIGNSSLLGTVKYVLECNDLKEFTENSTYIDLSQDEFFSNEFIENMEF